MEEFVQALTVSGQGWPASKPTSGKPTTTPRLQWPDFPAAGRSRAAGRGQGGRQRGEPQPCSTSSSRGAGTRAPGTPGTARGRVLEPTGKRALAGDAGQLSGVQLSGAAAPFEGSEAGGHGDGLFVTALKLFKKKKRESLSFVKRVWKVLLGS